MYLYFIVFVDVNFDITEINKLYTEQNVMRNLKITKINKLKSECDYILFFPLSISAQI